MLEQLLSAASPAPTGGFAKATGQLPGFGAMAIESSAPGVGGLHGSGAPELGAPFSGGFAGATGQRRGFDAMATEGLGEMVHPVHGSGPPELGARFSGPPGPLGSPMPREPGLGRPGGAVRALPQVVMTEAGGRLDAPVIEAAPEFTDLHDAISRARTAMRRAQSTAAEAQALHASLVDQRASRYAMSVKEAAKDLLNDAHMPTESLKRLSEAAKSLQGQPSRRKAAKGDFFSGALRPVQDAAREALEGLPRLLKGAQEILRRSWQLLDLRLTPRIAPGQMEALDLPKDPDYTKPSIPAARTASGCTCSETSECTDRGRSFDWCVVSDKERCTLRHNLETRDFQGADHRVASNDVTVRGPKVWDYCLAPPQDGEPPYEKGDALALHKGCHCAPNPKILDKYSNNPDFRGKDGRFLWERVPRRERPALEAMLKLAMSEDRAQQAGLNALAVDVAEEAGEPAPEADITVSDAPVNADDQVEGEQRDDLSLCVRVPSTKPFRICPAIPDENSGPSGGWCADHSYDFCAVASGKEGEDQAPLQLQNAVMQEVEEDREKHMINMQSRLAAHTLGQELSASAQPEIEPMGQGQLPAPSTSPMQTDFPASAQSYGSGVGVRPFATDVNMEGSHSAGAGLSSAPPPLRSSIPPAAVCAELHQVRSEDRNRRRSWNAESPGYRFL